MRERQPVTLFCLFCLLTIFFTAPIKATQNINTEAISKALIFFYAASANGEANQTRPVGTGFLLVVPTLSDPKSGYVVLVTARHVVDPVWAGCPGPAPSRLWVRLNKKSYDPQKDESGIVWFPTDLNFPGNQTWFFASDDGVDVAVSIVKAETVSKQADYNVLPFAELATNEEANRIVATDPNYIGWTLLAFSGS